MRMATYEKSGLLADASSAQNEYYFFIVKKIVNAKMA
jgi:hypothetical protein